MSALKSLCVYCGHRPGNRDIYKTAAIKLGEEIAKNELRLIYGGGAMGLMGDIASTTRDAGGKVFGVIPEFLVSVEGLLENIDHEIVSNMHERKMLMFEEADAICTMPGGIGTLEEIIEILSWARLNLHRKPVVLLNLDNFWSPLVELVDHIIESDFATPELRKDLIVVDRPEDVIPAAQKALEDLRCDTEESAEFEKQI